MTDNKIDIDRILDYKSLFKEVVKKARIMGDQMSGLCPVHSDKNASFSVNLKTGQCKCFTCGFTGNYISLYAQMHNIDQKEAYKQICEANHIELQTDKPVKAPEVEAPKNYTLAEYAAEKHLPIDYLQTIWKLSDKQNAKSASVQIPYCDIDNKVQAIRYRNHPKSKMRFYWRRGDKAILYGLQLLKDAVENQRPIILVEGESDTQTLVYMGFDAIGVPGATTFNANEINLLNNSTLYIHVENDRGGQSFYKDITTKLRENGYKGEVYKFSCSETGHKDPSALFIANQEHAAEQVQGLLDNALKIDIYNEAIEPTISGAPINLRTPAGYEVGDHGIWQVSAKPEQADFLIIKTPLLITKRLISYDAQEEKIEIAFKRDDKFISGTFSRDTVYNTTSILGALCNMGAVISSSNAKYVVKYLTALEEANIDVIPTCYFTRSFGWLPKGQFLPYHAKNVQLDAQGSLAQWAGSCTQRGSLDKWLHLMAPHRERYRFRFILSASFTAPLLKLLKCRSFLVYNWADSRGGKTASLKAALSVWGDPERMMITFNSTKVALERMASFFCDIPLGIDERQLAGSNQESIETIFYMLSNGTSRGRGTKDGGIQEVSTWRTVALTTGEEPVQTERTMTGVSTRTIEIIGAPFDNEAQASQMHQCSGDNTGYAGAAFMAYVLQAEHKDILDIYNSFYAEIEKIAGSANGSHLASLAAVATADRIVSEQLYKEAPEQAYIKALDMVKAIVRDMQQNSLPDVNVSACSYILDYYQANKERNFTRDSSQACYGWLSFMGGDKLCIYPTYLRKILSEGGYSYRKTLEFLKAKQAIDIDPNGKCSIVKKIEGRSVRVVSINIDQLEYIIKIRDQDPMQEELPF